MKLIIDSFLVASIIILTIVAIGFGITFIAVVSEMLFGSYGYLLLAFLLFWATVALAMVTFR